MAKPQNRTYLFFPEKIGAVGVSNFGLKPLLFRNKSPKQGFAFKPCLFKQCDHWYRNLRRPCVRTTAGLNSRIPAAGVSAPCRLNKTQQSNITIIIAGAQCRIFARLGKQEIHHTKTLHKWPSKIAVAYTSRKMFGLRDRVEYFGTETSDFGTESVYCRHCTVLVCIQ